MTNDTAILELLAQAEQIVSADETAAFLQDKRPRIRRMAVTVIAEAMLADGGPALVLALLDEDATVRGEALCVKLW